MSIVPGRMVHACKLQGNHEMEIAVASIEDIMWRSMLEMIPMLLFFLLNKPCLLATLINWLHDCHIYKANNVVELTMERQIL